MRQTVHYILAIRYYNCGISNTGYKKNISKNLNQNIYSYFLMLIFKVAYVEVSPNFAGSIMGIVNGIANAMGIVVPMVAALLVDGNVRNQCQGWVISFFKISKTQTNN